MHDHVHFAGAGHTVIGVGTIDAAVGEVSHMREPSLRWSMVFWISSNFLRNWTAFSSFAQRFVFDQFFLERVILSVCICQDLFPDHFKDTNQKSPGTAGRITDNIPPLWGQSCEP